jgi:hypothetical protein
VRTSVGTQASASVTVYVIHGDVHAVISGGSTRTQAIDQTLSLDATASSDNDLAPGSAPSLIYLWNCVIVSDAAYGESCGLLAGDSSSAVDGFNSSVLSVAPYSLSLATTYLFSLVAVLVFTCIQLTAQFPQSQLRGHYRGSIATPSYCSTATCMRIPL